MNIRKRKRKKEKEKRKRVLFPSCASKGNLLYIGICLKEEYNEILSEAVCFPS